MSAATVTGALRRFLPEFLNSNPPLSKARPSSTGTTSMTFCSESSTRISVGAYPARRSAYFTAYSPIRAAVDRTHTVTFVNSQAVFRLPARICEGRDSMVFM